MADFNYLEYPVKPSKASFFILSNNKNEKKTPMNGGVMKGKRGAKVGLSYNAGYYHRKTHKVGY